MSKRIVDYDPFTGMTTTFDYDHVSDTTYVGREQNVSALLDRNKAMANDDFFTRDGWKRDWWLYASIPNIVIEKWRNEHGVDIFNRDHEKKVYSLLNQPEYKYLKTTSKFHWG